MVSWTTYRLAMVLNDNMARDGTEKTIRVLFGGGAKKMVEKWYLSISHLDINIFEETSSGLYR